MWTRRSTTVVFPVPDGAETTNSRPRRVPAGSGRSAPDGDAVSGPPLLDILDLFPHLLEFGLERHDQLRHRRAFGLGPGRIHLAIHFLKQEVQFTAAGLRRDRQGLPVLEMTAET